MRHRCPSAVAFLATVCLVASCEPDGGGGGGASDGAAYQAPQPDIAVTLEGEGNRSALPLGARLEVFVEDERTLRLRITNTSPDTSSSVDGAPNLVRVGFNVGGPVPEGCLRVSAGDGGPAALDLAPDDSPFCASAPPADPDAAAPFAVDLASAGAGVARAQTREVIVRVDEGCAGAVRFSREGLLEAPRTTVAGRSVRWAAHLTRVGLDGDDDGCALGDAVPAPERRPVDRVWTNFVAASAEVDGSPSEARAEDTRAGSVEARFDDGVDARGRPVPAAEPMSVATLRNGAGAILEQWHVNDPWHPETLGPDHCDTATAHPRCYVVPEGGADELAGTTVALPTAVRDSNAGFDAPDARVEIEGTVGFRAADGARFVQVRWVHPDAIGKARLNLRVQTDGNLDGDVEDDPLVTLYRARWPGSGADLVAPPVTVIEETATTITIEVDVDAARAFVREVYGVD